MWKQNNFKLNIFFFIVSVFLASRTPIENLNKKEVKKNEKQINNSTNNDYSFIIYIWKFFTSSKSSKNIHRRNRRF